MENNIYSLTPLITLLAGALILMLLSSKSIKQNSVINLTLVFLTLTLISAIVVLKANISDEFGVQSTLFSSMLFIDNLSLFGTILLSTLTIIVLLASKFYFKSITLKIEYFSLLLFALFGMILMGMGAELISMFIALEIASLSLYILVGFDKSDKSTEAILKYFILSSFIGAFYIMGSALVYGVVGSTNLIDIANFIAINDISNNILFIAGTIFIFSTILFKVTAFPFHSWSLDVYSGANLPITALLVGVSKVAGFLFFIRVAIEGFIGASFIWQEILFFVTIATLFTGNLLSFRQESVKKMLIASSIVHSGYMLIFFSGVNSFSIESISPILFYLFAYSFAIVGALTIMSYVANNRRLNFEDFKGLSHKRPITALALTLLMLSFIGYPLTIGFLGKFHIFASALENGALALVVFGIINTILSLYYYLKIIIYMYFYEYQDTLSFETSPLIKFTVTFTILIILLGGFGLIDIDLIHQFLNKSS